MKHQIKKGLLDINADIDLTKKLTLEPSITRRVDYINVRKTDEDIYFSLYVDYYRSFAPAEAAIDQTPPEAPSITSKLLEFSKETLFINRHLKLTPYAKEALYIYTGFKFTTKVILTEKRYFRNSRALRSITVGNVLIRDHGHFSCEISNCHGLFETITKLKSRDISTFETYKEPKPSKKSVVKTKDTTKKGRKLTQQQMLENALRELEM